MKKLVLMIVMMAAAVTQKGFTQTAGGSSNVSVLLSAYYPIKDALVSGDAAMASNKAAKFVEGLNSPGLVKEAKVGNGALLKAAREIASTKDIKTQRTSFSALSKQMIALVKSAKPTGAPAYEFFCPMKKSSWLSMEKTIKNPYFGSSMLSCGSLVE
jgi:hypothetical protein